MLEVKNLNLGFECEDGFHQALYDVTFSLKKGNTLALVGESGCGKTISAMSILKLLPKNAKIIGGEICYLNKNILSKSEKDLQKIRGAKIALIPQDPMTSLNPLYTIGNQLLEVIKIHQNLTGKQAYQKAIEALDAVKIPCAETRFNSYPHEFSGGMKQRAIIAMALACNAEVIIADEPTTALDVTIQAQIMDLLRQIKKQNDTSVLLITHDLALVNENADEICVMYAGSIVERAPSKLFFNTPNHPYSLALLKALPTHDNLETIDGQPPTIQQQISGCKFHPRCKNCMEICREKVPLLKEISKNHFSACWLNNL